MVSVINDVSTLTTIPKETLNKLTTKGIWSICNAIYENELTNNKLTEVDIGIGRLLIQNEDDTSIKYKFIPSSKFEDAIKEVYINKKNPLNKELEKALINKITKTYKDFI